MDKAKSSLDALKRGKKLLIDLEESLGGIINAASSELTETFPLIDEKLKKELNEFIDLLESFRKAVSYEFDENKHALDERIERIKQYQQAAYHHRNINI